MKFIRIWTMQVAGAVIFGILCEMLAPEGKLKSIVRIVLGLILVIAVINPFTGIADLDLFLAELTFIDNLELDNELETLQTRTTLINAYTRRLSDEITPHLARVTQDYAVDVRLEVNTDGDAGDAQFGEITDILVLLTPQYREGSSPNMERIQADIISVLTNEFGIDEQNIRFWRDDFGVI